MSVLQTAKTNKENTLTSTDEFHKLRVELNDKSFQIRKMQEDYAEQKGKLLMAFNKEKVSLNKMIVDLKERIHCENEAWTAKIDQLRTEATHQIQVIQQGHLLHLEEVKIKLTSAISQQFHSKVKQMQETIESLNNQSQEREQLLKHNYQSKIHQISQETLTKINEADSSHHKQIKDFKKECEERIEASNNLYNILSGFNNKLKKQNEEIKRKQFQEVRALKSHITTLNETIFNFSQQIQKEKEKNLLTNANISTIQNQNAKQIKELNQDHEKVIKELEKQFSFKISEDSQKHKNQLLQINKSLEEMKKCHTQKEFMWEERGKKILELFQHRESKKEDIKMIQNLEVELVKKQFQLEKERKDLKNCQLELENMEDVYDRVFASNTYLNKVRSKSFKVKRVKMPSIFNQSNRSTLIESKK